MRKRDQVRMWGNMEIFVFQRENGEFHTNSTIAQFLNREFNCTLITYRKTHFLILRLALSLKLLILNVNRLRNNYTLIFQFPPKFEEIPTILISQTLGHKPIAIVHDLDHLRNIRNLGLIFFLDRTGIKMLKKSKVIVHPGRMADYLELMGVQISGHFELWPHTVKENQLLNYSSKEKHQSSKQVKIKILYAGNLDKKKCAFLYDIDNLNRKIEIYGESQCLKSSTNITIFESFPSDEPPLVDYETIGLIWDGDSLTEISGIYGRYQKINLPAKLSLYMAMGIPVVVSKDSNLAAFVEEEQIGICVSSLMDIPRMLSVEVWERYRNNCSRLRGRVTSGVDILSAVDNLIKMSE